MLSRRVFTSASLTAIAAATLGSVRGQAAGGAKETFEITKTPEDWKKLLTPAQYYVLREHGTERAGTSPLDKRYDAGIYACAGCNLPVYSSETKFNSGTGWPSFWKEIDGAVGTSVDKSLWMTRTEVHCRRCGGHLGHVFDDGPKPTGLRHCINGVALTFTPKAKDVRS
jgi:peptide-methionine (R)-S-oxide reductase